MTFAATTVQVKILTGLAFLRFAGTLAFVWIVIVWGVTCWRVSALTLTCVIVVILVWPAQLDYLATTITRGGVEILVVSAH